MTDDEHQVALELAWELLHLPPMEVGLRPQTVFKLVGLLQLANRHPGLSPDLRGVIAGFVASAREYFASCPTVLNVIQLGDDPTADLPNIPGHEH